MQPFARVEQKAGLGQGHVLVSKYASLHDRLKRVYFHFETVSGSQENGLLSQGGRQQFPQSSALRLTFLLNEEISESFYVLAQNEGLHHNLHASLCVKLLTLNCDDKESTTNWHSST